MSPPSPADDLAPDHSFRLIVENVNDNSRRPRDARSPRRCAAGPDGQLQVLLWQRAIEPDAGRWALPGGRLGDSEDVRTSVLRQLAEKVDVREVAHVEQLEVFSAPDRMPHRRTVVTAFLGLVPCVARSRAARRHGMAPGDRCPARDAAHRLRPRPDRASGPGSAARQAVLHQPRLRAGAAGVHRLRSARALRGCAGPPSLSDQPAASAGPPWGAESRLAEPPRRDRPVADPRRCTASRSAACGSPTRSRCCGHRSHSMPRKGPFL